MANIKEYKKDLELCEVHVAAHYSVQSSVIIDKSSCREYLDLNGIAGEEFKQINIGLFVKIQATFV